ncbi:MAG: AEC family transporter [Spirochaetota bacterium]
MFLEILPVFIIIAVGFLLSLTNIANDSWVAVLNRFGLYVGFPALIFVNLTDLDRGMLIQQLPIFFTTVLLLSSVMLVMLFAVKKLRIPAGIGMALLLTAYNGNVGYLGYPLITSLLPEAGATVGLIISAYSITTFSLGLFFLEYLSGTDRSLLQILKAVLTSPFVIAAFAGLLVIIFDIQIAAPIQKTLHMIEASASPVVLTGLGIFIQRKINIQAVWKPVSVIFVLKMVMLPVLFFAVQRAFSLGSFFDIAILESMMPVALTNFALCERYPIDKEVTVSSIIVTTAATPLLFPLLAGLL